MEDEVGQGITRHRGKAARAGAIVLLLGPLAAACTNTTATSTPTASASVSEVLVDIGQQATTGAGNLVTVFSYVSPVTGTRSAGPDMIFSAADVQACGGAHASARTGVSRSQFALQTPNQTGWASVDPVKTPALKDVILGPNKCERGWITFRLPADQKPLYLVLLSSNLVKWRIK